MTALLALVNVCLTLVIAHGAQVTAEQFLVAVGGMLTALDLTLGEDNPIRGPKTIPFVLMCSIGVLPVAAGGHEIVMQQFAVRRYLFCERQIVCQETR